MVERRTLSPSGSLSVVHVTPIWLPRTQTWLYNQVRFLPPEIETHVVCEKTAHLDQFAVPKIHCLADEPPVRRLTDRALRKIGIRRHLGFVTRVAEQTESTILHSHFAPSGWHNMDAAVAAGALHVVSVYGADVTQAPQSASSSQDRHLTLFRRVAAVFCEGTAMADQVIALGCPREKAVVHHLGVDLEQLPFRPRVWTPGTKLRVLIAATFREKKGIPYAIRALGRVRERADLAITVIGDATGKPGDREEKDRILSAINECGLADRTELLGFQPHAVLIEEAYRHHIFLSPSITAGDGDAEGGAPVSIIEMAASGMPIVSSLHCDIPEIVLNGKTGWLAPERDAAALAGHLEWLIDHPDEWGAFLSAARTHMELEYDCRTQGRRLADHYRRLSGA